MTVEELKEHEEEIKQFWFTNRDFKQIAEHFGVVWEMRREWMWLATKDNNWKKELFVEEASQKASELTDEDANKLLELSRKRAIIMLSEVLKHYEENPKQLRGIDVKEVSRLYSIIKSAEEQAKRTDIAFHKEKRETVQMILPYQRLNEDQLKALREKANAELNQLAQPA